MHPTISYLLAHAREANLRQQAQRDTLARAVRRARPGRRGHAVRRWLAGWRLAVALILRFVRTGGVAMLRMMGGSPQEDAHASHTH
jgi:hypothetical protein